MNDNLYGRMWLQTVDVYAVIIVATLGLQLLTVYLALSSINQSGKRKSGLLVLAAALVLLVCQCSVLYRSITGGPKQHDPVVESAIFIVSAILFYLAQTLRREGDSLEIASRLQAAVASGNMGIWDWDLKKNKVLWDDRMAELYDIPRESMPRCIEDWEALLHQDDGAQARAEFQAALLGERGYDTEFRITPRNGTLKVIKTNGLIIRDGDGTAVRMVGLNRDITEQRWAEREIVSLNESLEHRVAERTRQIEQANEKLREEIAERAGVEQTLKSYTAQLKMFSSRMMEARESERRHIAHELHDEIGQELTGLKLALDRARRAADTTTAKRLSVIQEQVETLMSRARDLSFNLRPCLLDDLGLAPALKWHFSRYAEQTGVKVDFQQNGESRRFPVDIEIVLFRVIQEALTNVARHANVGAACVFLEFREFTVIVRIEDMGSGFYPEKTLQSGMTLGLTGMRERVEDAGGSLQIRSEKKKGTQLTISIPLMCPLPGCEGSALNPCA